ncbi:MAG: hypothetical protein IE928_10195 [Gammaproteobacteria bacterium]|nr:hypothetical protein [Gammaproteobacteria bacterium]
MEFIRPSEITDAMLTSDVPENDYPEWVSGQVYTQGTRVIRTQTHRIYSLIGTNGTTPPEDDELNWLDEAPTNRWAMFDRQINTATEQVESITVSLVPGRINALALLELQAYQVIVTLEANGETVFSATYSLVDINANVGDWYGYLTEPIEQVDYLYIDQLIDSALLNIPAYGNGVLTITLNNPGGVVRVGMLKVGMLYPIGDTTAEPDLGITDYSLRKIDAFGNRVLTKRAAAKDLRCDVRIDTVRLDSVFSMLYRYKDEDLVWIPAKQHGSMIIYGLATWRIKRQNSIDSILTMTLEGSI